MFKISIRKLAVGVEVCWNLELILKMHPWKRRNIYKTVSFRGCTLPAANRGCTLPETNSKRPWKLGGPQEEITSSWWFHPIWKIVSSRWIISSNRCRNKNKHWVATGPQTSSNHSHRIHVWYIYLHEWLILMVNVGKYTIHGWFGIDFQGQIPGC